MAIEDSAVWRVRPGGSNTNGGGYDAATSNFVSGTNGSITGITFADTVANGFVSGMVGTPISLIGIGQFTVVSFIDSGHITLAVGAGGVLPQISGKIEWFAAAGIDYSQQNSPQLSVSDAASVTATSIVTSITGGFTSSMTSNMIYLTGTNFVTGWYNIITVSSSNTIHVDRDPTNGSNATGGTLNVGGAWADPWTNLGTGVFPGPLGTAAFGNIVYVLGSGIPNPSAYIPDYIAGGCQLAGAAFTIAADPMTPFYKPAPDTTGGMPVIAWGGGGLYLLAGSTSVFASGLWYGCDGSSAELFNLQGGTEDQLTLFGCVSDHNGNDCNSFLCGGSSCLVTLIGSELFSSVPGSGGSNGGINHASAGSILLIGTNIHDLIGYGIATAINTSVPTTLIDSTIAKCGGDGLFVGTFDTTVLQNCTIDGNAGNGVDLFYSGFNFNMMNTILSNHTGAGKFGLGTTSGGFIAPPNFGGAGQVVDYNSYFNNATDIASGLNYGPHDTRLVTTPYKNQSIEDYALA